MAASKDSKLQPLSWKISGMDCASCVAKVRGAVEKMPGVSDFRLSLMSETMKLKLDETRTSRQAVEQRVKSLGFGAIAMVESKRHANDDVGQAHDHDKTEPSKQTLSWKVAGMDCASCAAKIRGAVERLPGVSNVKVSVISETLTLALDAGQTAPDAIEKRVKGLGYTTTALAALASPAPAAKEDSCGCGHDHGHAGHTHDHHDHDHAKHDHGKTSCSGHDHGPSHDHEHGHNHGHEHGQSHDHAGHKHDHDHNHDQPGDKHAAHSHSAKVSGSTSAVKDHGHGLPGHVHEATPDGASWYQTGKGRLVIATGLFLGAAYAAGLIWPGIGHWAFIVACVVGVAPVAKRAFAAARAGIPFTIEMLMTIAAIGALFIGAAEEAALVVFLFAVGEVLEGVAADRARASIRALGDLVPKTAIIEENGSTRQVDATSLRIGQTVLVRPGDRIPADGEITDGTSGIDESPVTGESMPKTKGVGEPVYAGSVNREAALRVRVDKAAEDNTIARIIRLVEEAQEARAPTERFIDRFSRWYMPAIVGLAVLVALLPPLLLGAEWSVWIYRALALLLIGCPCALVISVPASIAAALSTGARQGLLMKGGVVIEAAAKTGVVAFDKTGTLTAGTPRVTEVIALGEDERRVVELAASVETGSNHPLAEAILDRAKSHAITVRPAQNAAAIAGQGVTGSLDGISVFVGAPRHAISRATFDSEAKANVERLESDGKTVAAVIAGDNLVGLIALRDEPRDDAALAVAELKAMGIRSLMLTGDNARTGAAIAGGLGMEHKAELMPDDKVTAIKSLASETSVMMVGDGINDAPALAAANVGVAMGSGTDVALETADGAVLKSRVRDVAAMIRLARATMGNIRTNITIALALKGVFLVTSVLGYTGLWVAILADTGATVIVTANALRLLRFNASQVS
ncbi:heavy metal translocating P-type ATPase [Bosea sp. 47.2.35]|jgi:Cd2+/Zn2+-exporting ATPase|uniref:heavy metal translocating P-type ATPase n=1 Tax=Bosea sp. 47.2.35 TaxID=2969304 RepID=UPI00214FBAD4|nr:heavy metal translocating P-type ATPase [Bosea sp. 47.2.35]MCR4524461.1 heavy metal translocating P-type ATPase [Bosea sp. 47.2.35]